MASTKAKAKARTKEGRDSSPAAGPSGSAGGKARAGAGLESGAKSTTSAATSRASETSGRSTPVPPQIQLAEGISRDVSMLRQPIDLGTSGAAQIARCIQFGTQEVHDTLVYECDIVYECKVCRSMFRGLPNFMAHKRVYCTTQYEHKSLHYVLPHLNEPQTIVVQPEAPPENPEIKVEDYETDDEERTEIEAVTYPVMDKMQKQTELEFYNKAVERERLKQETREMAAVRLSPIQGNPNAMFQIVSGFGDIGDMSGTAVVEMEPLQNGRPVRQPKPNKKFDDYEMEEIEEGGQRVPVVRPEAPRGFKVPNISPGGSDCSGDSGVDGARPLTAMEKLRMRSDCNIQEIRCLTCQTTYTTVKSLARHMTALHSNRRVYFPCLFCPGIFSQTSSAVRHIVRAHDKSTEEAERLRPQIREHSFIKQVEEFDIGDEMKNTSVRTWMMKKDPEIDPDTELRTTVSTENIINTPRPKATPSSRYGEHGLVVPPPDPSPTKKFGCSCGKHFSSSWNFTQHAMACKLAKAQKVKIPAPVKIRSEPSSPVKADTAKPAESPVKSSAPGSPKKTKMVAAGASPSGTASGSPLKKYRCHLCKKMYTSSWNYAQHIKSCGIQRRKQMEAGLISKHYSKKTNSNSKPNTSKPSLPKSGESTTGKSPGGGTCKTKEIQSESSDSDDSMTSDEEEVVIRPRFVANDNKKQASSSGSSSKKGDQRSKPHSGGGGGKEKKKAGSPDDGAAGAPPLKLSDAELEQIRQVVNEDEMHCLKCDKFYTSVSYLHRHAVRHLGWRRFKCKMCNYTSYNRSECTTHVRKVHIKPGMGTDDLNLFIRDLEPENMKQHQLSLLTRVERQTNNYEGLSDSSSQPASPTSSPTPMATNSCSNDHYNISTRRNTRVFDTKPYVRGEGDNEHSGESEDEEEEKGEDSLTTLRTRKGAYTKPDLLKRKHAADSEEETEQGTAKRKRNNSGVNGESGDGETKRSRVSAGHGDQPSHRKNTHQSRSGSRNGARNEESESESSDEETTAKKQKASARKQETNAVRASPGRSRKSERPQKSVAGSPASSSTERRGSPAVSAERRGEPRGSPARNNSGKVTASPAAKKTLAGQENVKKTASAAANTQRKPVSFVKTIVSSASIVAKKSTNTGLVSIPAQNIKMSQKIQDIVQNDVDNILQMVQGNKVQTTQSNLGNKRNEEVVILVVGENKKLTPLKSGGAVTTANPVKILSSKIISSPVSGGTVFATTNSGVTSLASRGIVSVTRSPVKILPKPIAANNAGKVSIFDKLAAAKQVKPGQTSSLATIPAPVATVTAGNRSPRRQQSVQK